MNDSLLRRVHLDEETLQRRRATFPLGAALTWEIASDERRMDVLHRLRAVEPVTWCDAVGGWLVTSRALAQEVYRSPDRFTVHAEPNLVRAVLGEMMLAVDGAEHDRHREPFNPTFKFRAVRERFESTAEHHATRLLDGIAGRPEADLCADYAAPFAVSMAAEVLGLELDQIQDLRQTYDLFAAALTAYDDPECVAQARAARTRLTEQLTEQLHAAREAKRPSLLADVAAAGALTEDEVTANARVIMFGAIETVEAMIVNTSWALVTHPEARAAVVEIRDLLSSAVDEALRWLPPVGFVERWATKDTTLGGVEIAAGDFVVPFLVAANRDPAHFPDPDRFDLHRANARQALSFSQAAHHCLGVNLARLEGRIAVGELFRRWPGLTLDPTVACEPSGFSSRRLHTLPVRLL